MDRAGARRALPWPQHRPHLSHLPPFLHLQVSAAAGVCAARFALAEVREASRLASCRRVEAREVALTAVDAPWPPVVAALGVACGRLRPPQPRRGAGGRACRRRVSMIGRLSLPRAMARPLSAR
jgi:hypothetical protein